MKKLLIIFFLTMYPIVAQTGVIKSYDRNGNVDAELSFTEDIYDGTSFWYYPNGNLKEEKTFSNGKLNGWCRQYYETGLLKEEFYVEDGVKNGIYQEYYNNGAQKVVRSYDKGVLIRETSFDYDEFYKAPPEDYQAGNRQQEIQEKNGNVLLCDADLCPIPIGGMQALQDSIHYPEHAKVYGLEGIVTLIAEISENGNVNYTKVIEGIGLGCDEEAQRVVQSTLFIPGQTDGKAVVSKITLNLEFRLSDKSVLASSVRERAVSRRRTRKDVAEVSKMNEPVKEDNNYTTEMTSEKKCGIDICPEPKGGIDGILENLYLPLTAQRLELEGIVIVDVDVDEYGFVRETKIKEWMGYGVDQAVELAIFETEFVPGKDGGEFAGTTITLEIPINTKEAN